MLSDLWINASLSLFIIYKMGCCCPSKKDLEENSTEISGKTGEQAPLLPDPHDKKIKELQNEIENCHIQINERNEKIKENQSKLIKLENFAEELDKKIIDLTKAVGDREEIIRIQYSKNLNMVEELTKYEGKHIKEQIKELDIKNKEIDRLKE